MSPETLRSIRTIRTLTLIAAVLGPISLILGGLVFAIAGFVLALIAFLQSRKLATAEGVPEQTAKTFRVTTLVIFVIDSVILVVTLISFILVVQIIYTMAENGTLGDFLQGQLTTLAPQKGSGSVWG